MRDCDPHYADNHFDSILALDLDTGAIKWATHTLPEDAWNVACIIPGAPNAACPENAGPDYDFAQAPVLYRAKINGVKRVASAEENLAAFIPGYPPYNCDQRQRPDCGAQSICASGMTEV